MADSGASARSRNATSLRERIPQLTTAQAQALRALHRRRRQWPSTAGTLVLREGRPGDPASVFELDADGSRVGLRLSAMPAADDDDALRWQDHQGRARVLAWSLAHETALVRLSEALGTSLLPLPDPPPAPAVDVVWVDFELRADDGALLTGSLRASVDWLTAALGRDAAIDTAAADTGHWRQLPAVVSLALAGPPLTAADLRNLRPGDVVIVGSTRQPTLHADAVGMRWPIRPGAEGWRIDGPPSPQPRFQESAPMSDTDAPDAPDTPAAEAPAPVEDPASRLPVEVAFELGKVELRLGDVAGLQPGYVFALPAHLEGANVTIRANGRIAGQGELVAVGDTLGVRLLSWS
ncbi:type III secretion system cytoplasmic ring protein SctQ [Luteimonas sp. TWI662]|uniref:type III secretion system cytoplasmic ring protein SctQ n=1 Tax=unclassified Luteimonas TaxID=2629088 RepID=UPI0032080407